MTVRWESFAGRTDRFAVRLALAVDPHDGEAASAEESATWGSVQLWVAGRNLTAHIDQGEVLSASHWYLLPIVEWLVANWDPIFHEERLPNVNSADPAVVALERSQLAPALAGEVDIVGWESKWHGWWSRHSLRAGRDGGLLPDIVLRRVRDYVEVSWDDRIGAGAPPGFAFTATSGAELFEPTEVAVPLHTVIEAMLAFLADLGATGPRLDALRAAFDRVGSRTRVGGRVHWLSGADDETDGRRWPGAVAGGADWGALADLLRSNAADPTAADAALDVVTTDLVITRSSPAALLFSTLSPTITAGDVRVFSQLLLDGFSAEPVGAELAKWSEEVPLDRRSPPWEQGYELAEALRDAMDLDHATGWVDVDAVLRDLGVQVVPGRLSDPGVRACSLVGPRHRPTILRNVAVPTGVTAWRFTAAHELCHLLFDGAHGAAVAIASGPWAPRGLEQRANAFAAMFLMPLDLVQGILADIPDINLTGVRHVAASLHVSPVAAAQHLYNLTLMSDTDRDDLVHRLEET